MAVDLSRSWRKMEKLWLRPGKMVLMCSMFAVFAVSDYPSISPSPVRFDMLDGSCSLHPQPKPQKPSCRDKKPFRGRCVKCLGMVDESRRFSGWIPPCWWVLLSCFGCVVLFAGRWELSWIYCWAAMRTRVWRRRGYITHLSYHWEWPVFSKTTVQTSGPIKKVYFCMAAQRTPTDVPEPRPRKEPIIFFKKAASRQIALSWLRVTFKIHKICRFDTPINLGSLMVPSFLGLAQPCSLCQARFEHRSGGGKVWLTMSPTSFHIVPNMAILCLSDFSLKSCHNYLGIQHRSFWWSLWSLHCSFFFASFFHFSIFLLR